MGSSDGFAEKILLTSLSAMVAETATFPIDVIKTRMQLHGESMRGVRRASAYGIASRLVRNHGIIGFYKGLSPAIFRHVLYTPTRIVGYEHLRGIYSQSRVDSIPFYSKAVIGGVSGAISQLIASPADLVKVRMQTGRYTTVFDAFKRIVVSEGFLGLWKGVSANMQRAFLVNMGELASYDHAKRVFIESGICRDDIYAHTLSSLVSGLAATALSCPADVVKTRMMTMNRSEVRYRNSYDCFAKTVRIEGFKALWKGFFPTWARLGPWQFVFWVTSEKLRHIAGLEPF